mgnify:CR=1 FL=1
MAKGTKYSQQFKEDAVQYRLDHPELPLRKAAENLGVSESALKNWMKVARNIKERFLPVVLEIMQVRKQKRLPDCSVNYEIRRMLLKC